MLKNTTSLFAHKLSVLQKNSFSIPSDLVNENINKATNVASEKGKEGLAKVKELIAQLQQQAGKL